MDYTNYTRPEEVTETQYFAVSAAKFVAMSFCTFGLYELYWSYKNWRLIKDRDGSDIRPVWRAIFYPFWHYSLLTDIYKTGQSQALSGSFYRGILAASLLILNALWRLPDPYWLISIFTFLPILPAVFAIASMASTGPAQQPIGSHRPVNFIAYLVGGPLLVFASLSTIGFLPPTVVVTGDDLWEKDIVYLREAGILGADEKILFFYSNGLLTIKEDGQFISDAYITSYWRDTEDGQTYTAYTGYEDIDDIDVVWAQGIWDLTLITITTTDEKELVLGVSSEAGGDRKFVTAMRRLWNQAKYSPNTGSTGR